MWHITSQKNGVSALGLQRVLGLKRYETVWIWLHKLRSAMVRPGRDRLSGIVEVDETYIGGQKPGKRGRGAEGKILVVIAVEDKVTCFGRIRLRRVADASAKSLVPAVQESVKLGSVVRTDGWSGYEPLPCEEYEHLVVRPSAEVGKNLLPLAHRVASLLKRWLAGTHQGAVRASHIDVRLAWRTYRTSSNGWK
ncbi:MAG: IS1595 family transposase [Deltaproteobacteria bacterium]|nr:IS1595 family transposase [Deltaproteobacteria bacterium]